MGGQLRGQFYKRPLKAGGWSFGTRVHAHGGRPYIHIGSSVEGWTERRAREEMENIVADVRRGTWRPPEPEPEPPVAEATFHEFSSEWYARREAEGLRPRSLEYLRWALTNHLLPHFARHRLAQITVAEVDRYAAAKAREGRLANGSINKTLEVLSQVMEVAREYGQVAANPAQGRRRRLPTRRTERPYLEPNQVRALLDAAGELDAEDPRGRRHRRALLATLAYAGLRIGEALELRWRDLDLANGRLRVQESKTPAGVRTVDVQPELRDELGPYKLTTRRTDPGDLVFATATGRADNRNNVRRRVLLRAVERANARVAGAGGDCEPLPPGLSPHALRRTFASWLVAEGEDPAYLMQQLGHTDPKMTLGLYAKALRSKRRRSNGNGEQTRDTREVPSATPRDAMAMDNSPG